MCALPIANCGGNNIPPLLLLLLLLVMPSGAEVVEVAMKGGLANACAAVDESIFSQQQQGVQCCHPNPSSPIHYFPKPDWIPLLAGQQKIHGHLFFGQFAMMSELMNGWMDKVSYSNDRLVIIGSGSL